MKTPADRAESQVFFSVAMLLLTSGWAANHFASLVVIFRQDMGLSPLLVNVAFGVYAVGLLPSLLGGGVLADRFGSRPVVLVGAVAAALGNVSLMAWNDGAGLMAGRLLVGVGVGLAVSAGTAWAGRLRGVAGTTMAGICLTGGFALGPIASGIVAAGFGGDPELAVMVAFALSVVLSLLAVGYSLVVGDVSVEPQGALAAGASAAGAGSSPRKAVPTGFARSMALSVPMALWVFACMTTVFIVMAGRVAPQFPFPAVLVPGIAAVFGFSSALIVQALGRRRGWGPWSGVVGAVCAAIGFLLAGLAGATPPIWLFIIVCVLMGSAYGFCLRQGLTDVDISAPPAQRGAAIGVFYVVAYLGFGLPALTEVVTQAYGPVPLMIVLAALAIASAGIRAVQIRSGYLVR